MAADPGNVAAVKRLLQALAAMLPDDGQPPAPPAAPARMAEGIARDIASGRVRP